MEELRWVRCRGDGQRVMKKLLFLAKQNCQKVTKTWDSDWCARFLSPVKCGFTEERRVPPAMKLR